MADWFDRLKQAAQHAGDSPIVWQGRADFDQPSPNQPASDAHLDSLTTPDASQSPKLLVLPKAARVMACAMPGVAGNLFFHHLPLESNDTAGTLYSNGGGIGGDRLWVAPESAFMWKNLADVQHDLASHALTPTAMDPAAYRVVAQSDHHLQLATDMVLTDDRLAQSLSLEVSRAFELINPPGNLPEGLTSISFAIVNELTLRQGGKKTHAGCWDLLQLPAGGTLICPTMCKADSVRSYYEPLGDYVQVMDDAVTFRIDAQKRVKMGLLPEHTTGRMGYYRQAQTGDDATEKISTLIVRVFLPCPGQRYVDLPVDEVLAGAHQGGDALQAYNHNDAQMAFGEMEYHDPAVHASGGASSSVGRCVTHILAGPDALIRQAGRNLLGVDLMQMKPAGS